MRIPLLLLPLLLATPCWHPAPARADGGGRGAVLIYRGSSDMGVAPNPAPPSPPVRAVGGGRVWLIDPEADSLTGCVLERTVMVGGRRIRCATRRLPSSQP